MYITRSGRAGMFVCYTAVCCSTKFVVAGTQNPMVIYCFIKSFYYQKWYIFYFFLKVDFSLNLYHGSVNLICTVFLPSGQIKLHERFFVCIVFVALWWVLICLRGLQDFWCKKSCSTSQKQWKDLTDLICLS